MANLCDDEVLPDGDPRAFPATRIKEAFRFTAQCVAAEAGARPLPAPRQKLPSDRGAHQRVLAEAYVVAVQQAVVETAKPMRHGLVGALGLVAVGAFRFAVWRFGTLPEVSSGHLLSIFSDAFCVAAGLPVFIQGVNSFVVKNGWLGAVLTVLFCMSVTSGAALLIVCWFGHTQPISVRPMFKHFAAIEAVIGAWDCALVASVALEAAAAVSMWRVYRVLRRCGLYPPDAHPRGTGPISRVSYLELVCEADDAEKWMRSCPQLGEAGGPLVVETISVGTEATDD